MSNEKHFSLRDELLGELVTHIRAFQNAVDGFDQAASEVLGLNRTDQRCADLLAFQGPMTAGQLAEASGMSTGAITAVIDRLERAGFVERYRDETDRRRVFIKVTDEGFQKGGEVYGPLGAEGMEVLQQYSNDEIRLFCKFMQEGAELNRRHTERLRREQQQGEG